MTLGVIFGVVAAVATAVAAFYKYKSLKLPKEIKDEAKKVRDERHRQIDHWLGHGRPPAGGMRDDN